MSKSTPKKSSAKPAKSAPKPAAKKPAPAKPPVKPPAKAPGTSAGKTEASRLAAATRVEPDPHAKAIMLNARKRKGTPAIFKIRARKNTPIVFTLDDVRELIKTRKNDKEKKSETKSGLPIRHPIARPALVKSKTIPPVKLAHKNRVLGAASLADVLGVTMPPKTQKAVSITQMMDNEKIPQKYRRFYKQLVQMREEIREGLDMHTQETLKRSAKEDSGDLSGYSQHMADAGTDTFDRDFALSLVSSEQELLFEIEEAMKRIRNGTYGICEITGQPISSDRLVAVPFTRYSLEGQKELEKQKRYGNVRSGAVGVFTEATSEDAAAVTEDDSDSA